MEGPSFLGDAGLLFDVYAMCPWCSMHLKWLDWYFNVALCYDTPIDELLHYTPDCAFDGSSSLSLWLFGKRTIRLGVVMCHWSFRKWWVTEIGQFPLLDQAGEFGLWKNIRLRAELSLSLWNWHENILEGEGAYERRREGLSVVGACPLSEPDFGSFFFLYLIIKWISL